MSTVSASQRLHTVQIGISEDNVYKACQAVWLVLMAAWVEAKGRAPSVPHDKCLQQASLREVLPQAINNCTLGYL